MKGKSYSLSLFWLKLESASRRDEILQKKNSINDLEPFLCHYQSAVLWPLVPHRQTFHRVFWRRQFYRPGAWSCRRLTTIRSEWAVGANTLKSHVGVYVTHHTYDLLLRKGKLFGMLREHFGHVGAHLITKTLKYHRLLRCRKRQGIF